MYEQMRKVDPLDAETARTERIRQGAAKTILNAQLRVNEVRLKARADENKLAAVMARLWAAKKELELEATN